MKLEEENVLKFTCKLSPESNDILYVSDGSTILFEIFNGDKSMGVGLDREDVKELIEYLNIYL
jgi:hypothetical protein